MKINFLVLSVLLSMVLGMSANSYAMNRRGLYGFNNNTSTKDRNYELRTNCGDYILLNVSPDELGKAVVFNDLCKAIGRKCQYVCDWEGNRKPCDEVSQWLGTEKLPLRDGTRVAFCK